MTLTRDRLGWVVAAGATAAAIGLFVVRGADGARVDAASLGDVTVACDPGERATLTRPAGASGIVVSCAAEASAVDLRSRQDAARGGAIAPSVYTAPASYVVTERPQAVVAPQSAPRVVEPSSAPAVKRREGTSWQKQVAIIGGSAGAGAAIGAIIGGKKGAAIGAAAGGGGATLFQVLKHKR